LLELELRELAHDGFDIALIGLDEAEVDLVLQGADDTNPDKLDEIPAEQRDRPSVSRTGDLWIIGEHRLLCGDALAPENFPALMKGAKAQCVFTDPPYNVPIQGHVSGLGKVRHREFAMAVGEMSEAAFTEFLTRAFRNLVRHSSNGCIHYVCMDWRHSAEILAAGKHRTRS
jgi:hypothetical protein